MAVLLVSGQLNCMLVVCVCVCEMTFWMSLVDSGPLSRPIQPSGIDVTEATCASFVSLPPFLMYVRRASEST